MFVKHADEIAKYIESRYPDIPVHVQQDISVFAATRAYLVLVDYLNDYKRLESKQSRNAILERYRKITEERAKSAEEG